MEIPLDEKCTEQLTVKVGSTLAAALEREARLLEERSGLRISRAELVRKLLVAGLEAEAARRARART